VNLAVGAYSFHQHHQDGDPADGWAIAVIVLACVFGAFTFGMALTSIRFIFLNTTNVDMLKRSNVIVLAVRIPLSTPSSNNYTTIVYPLRGVPQRPGSEGQQPSSQYGTVSARDQQAERKFAILKTKPHENPWSGCSLSVTRRAVTTKAWIATTSLGL
jgi:palmitoyltransferase